MRRRATCPRWISSPAITPTSCGPASCCAASACRLRRCRSASLTHLGRSAALAIGTQGSEDLLLTITAATPRPIQLRFERVPSVIDLQRAIDARIPADGYFNDVHGSAAYKRHLAHYFSEQIRAELAQPGAGR
jgi:hypothetical protein